MSASIGLAVTMIEQEKRLLRERLSIALSALRQIEELGEVLVEGATAEDQGEKICTIASSAISLLSSDKPLRPGGGKKVLVRFVRRPKGYAIDMEAHPQDFDVVDRMQVDIAFAAISDWMSVTGSRPGLSIRQAQDEALEALRERTAAALPGYRVIIEDMG